MKVCENETFSNGHQNQMVDDRMNDLNDSDGYNNPSTMVNGHATFVMVSMMENDAS